jgi:Ca2+-binding EF-hand superfamily protein
MQIKYQAFEAIDFTFSSIERQHHARNLVAALSNIDIASEVMSFTSTNTSSSSKHLNQGLISLPMFLQWMAALGINDIFCPSLTKFFKQFDVHSNMLADTREILCGLLCFASGSKSRKLSIAFGLFDETGEGFISRRTLWLILRSFARSIALFCEFSLTVDDISVFTASKIFKYYRGPRHVTLENVSDWYLFCGNDISFWIELLDTSKWVG